MLVFIEHIDPIFDVIQRFFVCDIKDDEGVLRIFQVVWNDRSKPLLTCCIPKLKSVCFALMSDIFSQKVYPDCRLHHKLFLHWLPN